MTNGIEKKNNINKTCKANYTILGKIATKAEVKGNKTDIGGSFYIFDLYDNDNNLIALNRYCFKNAEEQPFEELSNEEELILNPIIEEVPIEEEI